jgi:CYTH domain-containing protein
MITGGPQVGIEIERKFLIKSDEWRQSAIGTRYCQGYLTTAVEPTVRVRIAGDRGFITVKSATAGMSRLEFEYEIPLADADLMLVRLCAKPLIEKTRYRVDHGGLTWEIDEFAGENAGLIIAEVELESHEQQIELPVWVGREVTGDPRYYNACLVKNPFKSWAGEA